MVPHRGGCVFYELFAAYPQQDGSWQAMKTNRLILADSSSACYISGVPPDPRWDNDMPVHELARVKGSDFEAVDVSSLRVDPDWAAQLRVRAQAGARAAKADRAGQAAALPAATGATAVGGAL